MRMSPKGLRCVETLCRTCRITDRGFEHLAPSGQMITRTRRRLMIAARALRDQGALPPGVENADVFRGVRSGYFVSDDVSPWEEI